MNHIIRQKYLDVEVNGPESAGLAIQRMLSELCQNRIIPAIEKILDRYSPPNEHLYFERLNIDVGSLTLDKLESDLADSIARALEELLRSYPLPADSSPALISDTVRLKTAQQSVFEAFVYFLNTGRLPWVLRLPAGQSFEQVLLDSWREETKPAVRYDLIATVRSVLKSGTARKRLVCQFSPVFLGDLLLQLSPDGKKMMAEILAVLQSFDGSPVDKHDFIRHLWETVLAVVVNEQPLSAKFLVSETLRALPVAMSKKPVWTVWLEANRIDITKPAPLDKPVLQKSDRQDLPTAPQQDETRKETLDKSILQKFDRQDLSTSPQQDETRAETVESPVIDTADWLEGIYIDCAGLVLLHPFLPQFFEALGIAAEDTLLQPDRALCLMHYLATGQTFAPEYELILPKILCNISLETPVESDVSLTSDEQEEAEALLEAVIHHWDVLKNTGIDGLRGTFLLRAGKITLQGDGDWRLQVESKAYDILLDQLPWGIGMIKLPWMQRMLWVEWAN